MTKQELRSQMIKSLKASAGPDAAVVAERICALPEYREAEFVMGYAPLKTEVDVSLVMDKAAADGKTIAFPGAEPGEIRLACPQWRDNLITLPNKTKTVDTSDVLNINQNRDRMHLSEKHKGLILVPGLAFTEFGTRLGRGAGYYDQLLVLMGNALLADFISIGICRKTQLVEELPQQPHDKKVRMVIAF